MDGTEGVCCKIASVMFNMKFVIFLHLNLNFTLIKFPIGSVHLVSMTLCRNYVDHHISSREQITLQDTMEGVIFSTSQFGLDGKS